MSCTALTNLSRAQAHVLQPWDSEAAAYFRDIDSTNSREEAKTGHADCPSLLKYEDEQSSDHGSIWLPDHGVKLQGKCGQARNKSSRVQLSSREDRSGSMLLAQHLFSVEHEAHTFQGWEQVTYKPSIQAAKHLSFVRQMPTRSIVGRRVICGIIFGAFLLAAPFSIVTDAHAQNQMPSDIPVGTNISGHYLDSSTGLQIDLPPGWSGTKFFDMFPIVAPNGFDLSKGTMPEVVMTIFVLDRSDVDGLVTGGFAEIPSDFEENNAGDCRREVTEYSRVGSTVVLHMIQECDGDDETGNPYQKTKAYGILTRTNFIMIAYSATSQAAYEKHLGEFEQSVKTVNVPNSANFKSSVAAILRANKVYQERAQVQGQHVDIKIETSSRLSDFKFSEEERRVSFKVEGTDGTSGALIMPLQNLLAGPFTVTIDGQPTDDFIVIEDKTTGEQILQLSYSHSVHEIAVTGASVVPEFPVQLLVILGTVIGATAIITRTKQMQGPGR